MVRKKAKKRAAKKRRKKAAKRRAVKKRSARKKAAKKRHKKPARKRPAQAAAEWVAVDTLVPWDRNPRLGQEATVARLVELIPVVGFGAPLVARRSDKRVVAGHARLEAARRLGMLWVPVRLMKLTDEQAAAMTLADNRMGELTEWDGPAVASIVGDLPTELAGLMAWSDEELASMSGPPDPEEGAKAPRPRNASLYRIELTAGHEADFAPALTTYREGFPDASAADFVAWLAREYSAGSA